MAKQAALKLPRQERMLEQRQRLINAAAVVIGELGYRDASIAKISDRAQLAYGTFYRHFDSQQDLFESVLPEKGKDILKYIRSEVRDSTDPVDMERKGLIAFQDFLVENPGFFRLLSEGRVMAQNAHAVHSANVLRAFVRTMMRWRDKGYFQQFDDEGLRTIAMVLIGARDYLFMDSWGIDTTFERIPDSALEAYLELVRGVA